MGPFGSSSQRSASLGRADGSAGYVLPTCHAAPSLLRNNSTDASARDEDSEQGSEGLQ